MLPDTNYLHLVNAYSASTLVNHESHRLTPLAIKNRLRKIVAEISPTSTKYKYCSAPSHQIVFVALDINFEAVCFFRGLRAIFPGTRCVVARRIV